VRVLPAPGVTTSVCADGQLELYRAATGRRYRCDGPGTAMWIALRQHGGHCRAAADLLAEVWETDPDTIRTDLLSWADDLIAAGLLHRVTAGPDHPTQP
jgi:hypothetical protein